MAVTRGIELPWLGAMYFNLLHHKYVYVMQTLDPQQPTKYSAAGFCPPTDVQALNFTLWDP